VTEPAEPDTGATPRENHVRYNWPTDDPETGLPADPALTDPADTEPGPAATAAPDPAGSHDPGDTDTPEPDAPEPTVRKPAAGKPRRRFRKTLILTRTLVALLSVAVLTSAGLASFGFWQAKDAIVTTDILGGTAVAGPDAPPADDGAEDILLVGSDSRADTRGNTLPADVLRQLRTEDTTTVNTDTIMVLRIPRGGGRAYAVSIPRDTYVPIPGYREDKINAAYGVTKYLRGNQLREQGMRDGRQIDQQSSDAGRAVLVQVVQQLTGVRIDHYAEINLYGFYLLSKAIGGVPVCLNHATSDKDSGADFARGPQLVSGGDALSFVRQRENLPRGDLDRIVRQQVFLASAAKKMLSAGTVTDPGKLSALVDALGKSVVLDARLDLIRFIQQTQALATGNMEFVTIPVTAVGARNERGQSIITVDKNAVHQFVSNLIKPTPAPTTLAPTGTSEVTTTPAPRAPAPTTTPKRAPVAPAAATPPPESITIDGTACVN
jgi:LCP family protein required for cell wall assembly